MTLKRRLSSTLRRRALDDEQHMLRIYGASSKAVPRAPLGHCVKKAEKAAPGLLFTLCLCGVAANVSGRSIDPLITVISLDFSVGVATAALLTSAYSLPFAIGQPVLGPMGDIYGKTRVLTIGLWFLAALLLSASFAPTFWSLAAARFCAGLAAGGVIPACMATIGDAYPPERRQVAISRFVSVGLLAQIFAASAAGASAEALGWRGVLFTTSLIAPASALAATFKLPSPVASTHSFSIQLAAKNYQTVFQNPKAVLCYATVFLEGMGLYGLLPYMGDVLLRAGSGGPSAVGLVIGPIGVGGIVYTFAISALLRAFTRRQFMAAGGVFMTFGPLALWSGLPWQADVVAFGITGFGFMLLHNSIQTEVVELAPRSRQSAYSLHAFSFFTGQTIGPLAFGAIMTTLGQGPALLASAIVLAVTGLSMAYLFARLAQRSLRDAAIRVDSRTD